MIQFRRRLRTPEERVGMLSNASLPPPATSPVPDDELLRRALAEGDERAFAEALDRFFPGMLRLALGHVRSHATAEEVIQDTWLAALTGFDRFEGRSAIKTWLYRILRNQARTRARRDARVVSFSDVAASDDVEDATEHVLRAGSTAPAPKKRWHRGRTSDPELDLLSSELAARIDAAIQALPERQREVLVLRDVEGWPPDEVCNALGISHTNQRVILHRARDRVRKQLRGYVNDDEQDTNERQMRLR